MNNKSSLGKYSCGVVLVWCSVLLTANALAASGGPFVYFDQDYIEIGMCMAK